MIELCCKQCFSSDAITTSGGHGSGKMIQLYQVSGAAHDQMDFNPNLSRLR
jgi:hypothetical protein